MKVRGGWSSAVILFFVVVGAQLLWLGVPPWVSAVIVLAVTMLVFVVSDTQRRRRE